MHDQSSQRPAVLAVRKSNKTFFFITIIFLFFISFALILVWRTNHLHFHHSTISSTDQDQKSEKAEEQFLGANTNNNILQQDLISCKETLEMIKKVSANSQLHHSENNEEVSSSSSLFSFCEISKCSGHGKCFDPMLSLISSPRLKDESSKKSNQENNKNNAKTQKKKMMNAGDEGKEEQKRLVNSFGVAPISQRRRDQLRPGSCLCDQGFGGKDCSIPASVKTTLTIMTQSEAEKLISILIPSNSAKSFLESSSPSFDLDKFVQKLRKDAPNIEILASILDENSRQTQEIDDMNSLIKKAVTDDKSRSERPLLLILGPDVDFENFDLWRMNLPMMVDQMLTTDVDILGFMTIENHKKQEQQESNQDDEEFESRQKIFDPFCHQLHYHSWRLRHRKAPLGYERHQNFVMYCDRISNSFMVRKSMLSSNQQIANKIKIPAFLNKTLIGAPSDAFWPICAFSSKNNNNCKLFDSSLGNLAWIDFFLRIKRVNNMFDKDQKRKLQQNDKNKHFTLLLVGSCAECIIDIVSRNQFVEQIPTTPAKSIFTERHQIEVYFDAFGRRSNIVCVKSGGIYGHSNKGLYAPLCHRLMRQRDFLWISNMWTSSKLDDKSDEKKKKSPKYSVSLHHGNLFGALRFQEELFWETDGDFDLIAHDATHDELMKRFNKLVRIASSPSSFTYPQQKNKKHQKDAKGGLPFETIITYPEKPWYVAFKKEKTDFQINARSPLSQQTRGKPLPQIHNVSIPYQGRLTFMNGFANPWRSVRSDPGHDYRDLYLAQQGWVLHWTKNSVSCGIEGHNACLPDCTSPENYLFDHEFCSDENANNIFDRNPILWFDSDDSVMFREAMPRSRFVASEIVDDHNVNNNREGDNYVMKEDELYHIAKGETRKWIKNKLWQFL